MGGAVSIHAPRAGGDAPADALVEHAKKFQSTPPVRGATAHPRRLVELWRVSIHAPRPGGDLCGETP